MVPGARSQSPTVGGKRHGTDLALMPREPPDLDESIRLCGGLFFHFQNLEVIHPKRARLHHIQFEPQPHLGRDRVGTLEPTPFVERLFRRDDDTRIALLRGHASGLEDKFAPSVLGPEADHVSLTRLGLERARWVLILNVKFIEESWRQPPARWFALAPSRQDQKKRIGLDRRRIRSTAGNR